MSVLLLIHELTAQWSGGSQYQSVRPKKWSYPNSLAHAVRVHKLSRCLNLHALCLASTWLSQILHGRLRHPRTYPQPHLLTKTPCHSSLDGSVFAVTDRLLAPNAARRFCPEGRTCSGRTVQGGL